MKTSKQHFVIACLCLSFLFSSISISAATFNWLGGPGSWTDATKWDQQTVPTGSDEVVILSGTVRINMNVLAKATNVLVGGEGILIIRKNGTLAINGAVDKPGLENEGRVFIYGKLDIQNISATVSIAHGIQNDDYIFAGNSGIINITDIEGKGISNLFDGYFFNRGNIEIDDIDDTGISNQDRFRNTGTINITATSANDSGIGNFDNFINYAAGEINIDGGSGSGISNGNAIAVFNNYGIINISDAAVSGLVNSNQFKNYPAGNISISNSGIHGLYNYDVFTNQGNLTVEYGQMYGIFNQGDFKNQGTSNINFNEDYAIINYASSDFVNSQDLFLQGNIQDLNNESTFQNTVDGFIFSFAKIVNYNNITNDGIWTSQYISSHSLYNGSTFLNNGVIEDHYDSFSAYPANMDNQQIIVKRIPGTMQNGVIFSDPIDQVSLSNTTIGDWVISPFQLPVVIGGTYDDVNKEFLPNSNAVNQINIYINITINASGKHRLVSLYMDNPVQAIVQNNYNNLNTYGTNEKVELESSSELFVYPNPTNGLINLKADFFNDQTTDILVYNSLGQKVFSKTLEVGNTGSTLNFPETLVEGIYSIHAMKNGKSIAVKSVLLRR